MDNIFLIEQKDDTEIYITKNMIVKIIQSTLDTTNFDIMNFTIQQIFDVVQIILY